MSQSSSNLSEQLSLQKVTEASEFSHELNSEINRLKLELNDIERALQKEVRQNYEELANQVLGLGDLENKVSELKKETSDVLESSRSYFESVNSPYREIIQNLQLLMKSQSGEELVPEGKTQD